MAIVSAGPGRLKPLGRPERPRPHWAPTRPSSPAPSGGPSQATSTVTERDARREAATMSRSPKSPPPIKGQTGPRPGY